MRNKPNRTKKSYTSQALLNGFSVIHYRNSEIIEIPYEEYSISSSIKHMEELQDKLNEIT